jgi:hypothetical protein
MSFPPETPRDYFNYFYNVQNATPPDPKWKIGLKAARLWLEYCENDNKQKDNQELISIIRTFLPIRISGSVFLGLWQQILRYVAKLPVSEQKEIWLEVFNVANQGENQIKHNEEALKILKVWIELDNSAETVQIDKSIMIDMVNRVYVYTFRSYDWIAFTVALCEWFKKYVEEPSFYDSVCNKFEKNRN